LQQLATWDGQQVDTAIFLYKERVKTLRELVQELVILHNGPQKFQSGDIKKWVSQDRVDQIYAIINIFEEQTLFTHNVLAAVVKKLAKQLGVKLINLAQPIRIALIGKASGPGVFELLAIVGKIEVIRRLQVLLDNAQQIE